MHGYPGTPVGQLFGNQRRLGVAMGQIAQSQPRPSSQIMTLEAVTAEARTLKLQFTKRGSW